MVKINEEKTIKKSSDSGKIIFKSKSSDSGKKVEAHVFIGIDVSKESLDLSINGRHYKIKNKTNIINAFIHKHILTLHQINLCVLESTGGYERLIMKLLQNNDIPIHRAHPYRVHSFAKAINHFAKTDKLDAALLEKYAAFINHEENGDLPITEEQEQIQQLKRVENNLSDFCMMSKHRLEHLSGRPASYIKKQIKFAEKQLIAIRQEIEAIINKSNALREKLRLLTSCIGVGNKTASALIAELPELGTLNPKQIASLVGLAPKTFESGKKISKSHIRGGRFYIRKAIYMAALVASRHCKKIKEFYQKLITAGKPAKVALIAVARKIVVYLNAMIRDGKEFLVNA